MRRVLLVLGILSAVVMAGVALADDPGGHVQNAKILLAQAQAELDAAIAIPQATVTETITATITQTVTETVTSPPPPTTSVPPSPTPPPPPPPAGFPSRAEALARPNVVVVTGARIAQFKPATANDMTYDFRGLVHTGWPSPTAYPLVLEGARNVAVGGSVTGQQARELTWEQVHDAFGGYGERMFVNDYAVSYDFRVENVTDGIGMDPSNCGLNPGPAVCKFLIDGAYMEWIRDDGVEFDTEFSGTIRNVVMNGVNNAFSIGQSTKNANAVTNIENVLIIHAVMNNGHAADGAGHQTIFKQKPGGTVNMTNVTDCMYENPITPSRIQIRPPGTWTNVVFVVGPGWVGPDPVVPAGATVSHDWAGLCTP